jgi:hypothetical protein
MDAYKEEFMSEVEGANKHAVKRLTRTLEVELLKNSVNALDWWVICIVGNGTDPVGTLHLLQ